MDNSHSSSVTRREFLEIAAGTSVMMSLPATAATKDGKGEVPRRTLGRTGEKVSVVGLGGFHLGKPELAEAEAVRIIRTGIDNGITFLDNCWDYNGGVSEIRMGKALRDGYRKKVFLMTKIDGRDKKTAAQQIEESLRRLQTDHVDLLQFHEIIRMNDPERIFAIGGGMEAALEAKKAGKIRHIGFTGHKSPDIHLKMLETAAGHKFRFDSVQMPLNVMDAHYDSFEKKVLPVLVKDDIGVLGMKPMGDPFILDSKTVTATECLHYAMNLPTSVLKESQLWNGDVWKLEVTNVSERAIELRALMSASNSTNAWDLQCNVREALVKFLQAHAPQSLPQTREAELQP